MKLDKSYKVQVAPGESREIQKLAIKLGFEWFSSRKKVMYEDQPFLFLNAPVELFGATDDKFTFITHDFIAIKADELIAMMTDMLETEQSTERFKVGDKVYCGVTGAIREIAEINLSDMVATFTDELPAVNLSQCCYATPENYEMLCRLYPFMEFEVPPKPLTGSDLCCAMLKKGWKYVPCYVHDESDRNCMANSNKRIEVIRGVAHDGRFLPAHKGGSGFKHAVPIDLKTGEPLTEPPKKDDDLPF